MRTPARTVRPPRLWGAIILVLLTAGAAPATTPADQLRQQLERALRILEDPKLRGEANAKERRTAIRDIAASIFDFRAMAMRSLGPHWHGRTEAERVEFAELFTALLEQAYLIRIEEYRGELIRYDPGEIAGDLATVHTLIHTKRGTEIPVDYRMAREGLRWLVYDVRIEGVSLIASYRSQFNRIIATSSWAELIKRMKAKIAEPPSSDEGSG
jgi:phospholipid transport system substrate-binding protein